MAFVVLVEMLKEYLAKNKQERDFNKEHRRKTTQYKEIVDSNMQARMKRREVLSTVATLYKNEREEFYNKYRYF